MARALLTLMAALSSGCLFVGEVNQRPSAHVVALDSTPARLGRPIRFEVFVSDDDAGASAEVVVLDSTQARVDDPCIAQLSRIGAKYPGEIAYELILGAPDTYTIVAVPIDRLAARGSPSSLQLTVDNEAPYFPSTMALKPSAAPGACGIHYTTAPLLIGVAPNGEAVDPEAGLDKNDCPPIGSPLIHRYILTDRPTLGGVLGRPVGLGCPATPVAPGLEVETDGRVCLYPDPGLPTSTPSSYELVLEVEDVAHNKVRSSPLTIVVTGDAPACFDGTYPAVGAYTLPRDAATVFYAVGVDDVEPAADLSFVWSLARGGGDFAVVAPATTGAQGGSRFALDPVEHGFTVGEAVRLRVEVADAAGGPACAAGDDACATDSCAATGTTCPRRATWTLEYR